MEKFALPPRFVLLAMLMVVVIAFPKPLFCEATQLLHRGTHTQTHTSDIFFDEDIRYIACLKFFSLFFLLRRNHNLFIFAGLLQSGGIICPDCVCCEDPRPSVRRTSCCACCSNPTARQSDKGLKGAGF